MKHSSCDHIGLFSKNAGELIAFYTGILGFELTSDSVLSKAVVERIFGLADDCRFVKLHREDFMIEIFQPCTAGLRHGMNGVVGINHWGFRVDDRIAFVDKMRRAGQRIVEIDRNGRAVYFLIDPDGNRIEVRENPR